MGDADELGDDVAAFRRELGFVRKVHPGASPAEAGVGAGGLHARRARFEEGGDPSFAIRGGLGGGFDLDDVAGGTAFDEDDFSVFSSSQRIGSVGHPGDFDALHCDHPLVFVRKCKRDQ